MSTAAITPYLHAKLDLIDFLKNAFGPEVMHGGQRHLSATPTVPRCDATVVQPHRTW